MDWARGSVYQMMLFSENGYYAYFGLAFGYGEQRCGIKVDCCIHIMMLAIF